MERNFWSFARGEDVMKVSGMCACVLAMCLAATAAAVQEPVTRHYRDVDADGMPEIILENAYVRVSLTTGQPAVPEVERFNEKGRRIGMKYGARFNWGGWIWDFEYKPTGRAWCVHIDDSAQNWHGIPECFESSVKMSEKTPGHYDVMVPGIGVGTGRGACFRWSLRDIVYSPWTVREERLVDGVWQEVASPKAVSGRPESEDGSGESLSATAWRVHFRQVIDTVFGYGCDYTKTVTLRAGSSCLEVERKVRNTGRHPWGTVFFTHGFWGQGAENAMDQHSWSTVPLRPPAAGRGRRFAADLTDTEPAYLHPEIAPAYYWGSITNEVLAGNWHALGNSETQEIFMNALNRDVTFFRNWTDAKTYSIEPFLNIDVAPGEEFSWLDVRGCGQGLRGVKAQGRGGMIDWEVSRGENDACIMNVRVLPYVAGRGRIRLAGQLATKDATVPVTVDADAGAYASNQVISVPLTLPGSWLGAEARVSLSVKLLPETGGEQDIAEVSGTFALRDVSRVELPRLAKGAQAVVFTDLKRDKATGAVRKSALCLHLESLLQSAGFTVKSVSWNAPAVEVDWRQLALAVVAHSSVSVGNMRRLEAFAARGGGVLFQGPVAFQRYLDEGCALLPIASFHGAVDLRELRPRDGSREFASVPNNRFHLTGENMTSPILAGLPLYPESYQEVAFFQMVRPEAGAEVVASWVPGSALPATTGRYPALVTARRGKGRVALLTSSVLWGAPDYHVLWGRLGEYHRRFVGQLAQWLAGNYEPLPETAPKACENASWLRRHEANVAELQEAGGAEVLLLGDGVFGRWDERDVWPWQRLRWRRRVLDWGMDGDGADEVRWRVEQGGLAGQSVELVAVHLGADAGTSAEAWYAGVQSVLTAVRRSLPKARLLVLAPEESPELWEVLRRAAGAEGGFEVLVPDAGKSCLTLLREVVRGH